MNITSQQPTSGIPPLSLPGDVATKTAILVEDEHLSRLNLKRNLDQHCPDVEIIGEATSNAEFLELIRGKQLRPDIAFLDINLPDGAVFETLKLLRPLPFQIIFITAYDEYAMRACWFASMAYILKPIDPLKLAEAVQFTRVIHPRHVDEQLDITEENLTGDQVPDRIALSDGKKLVVVAIKDIIRIKADDNYSHVFTTTHERPIIVARTLLSFQKQLKQQRMFRIHKGHFIHIDHMTQFNKGTKASVVMDDGEVLTVGRRRKAEFREFLRRMGLDH